MSPTSTDSGRRADSTAPHEPPQHDPEEGPVLRLRPSSLILRRGTDRLQLGLVPDRAVEWTCPEGTDQHTCVELLSRLDGTRPVGRVLAELDLPVPVAAQLRAALEQLEAVGHLLRVEPAGPADTEPGAPGPYGGLRLVHVIGTGPLAHRLRTALELNGCTVRTSAPAGRGFDPARPQWRKAVPPDLVVLTDIVCPDPLVTRALVRDGLAHLHLHCRDSRVVAGPLVVPGHTSCLRCADLHRAEQDPWWPMVAAQLMSVEPEAPAPALAAAVALVLSDVAAARSGRRPQTAGATVEISPAEGVWRRVHWPAHERCDCGAGGRRVLS